MTRVAVLGAGVTGLVIANRVARDGHQVDLIEASPRLGGNHKSVEIGPYTFDIGTFVFPSFSPFFAEFPGIWELCHRMDYQPLRITPKGNVHRYPFDTLAYFREQGALGTFVSVAELAAGKILNFRKRNVAEYAKYYVGRRVYEQSGLRTYIERLFGLPDEEIDTAFASKRMTEIANVGSLRNMARRALPGRRNGFSVEWATRPRSGFATIYEAVGTMLEGRGVSIWRNTRVRRIEAAGSGFRVEADGLDGKFDRVISTIPLPILERLLGVEAGSGFPTATLFSLFYSHAGDLGFRSGTLYNFSPTGLWKRVTVLSHYFGQAEGRDYFTVEVTLGPGTARTVEDLRADFEQHVRSVGLMGGELRFEGVEETPGAYPLYRLSARQEIERAKQRLMQTGVEIVGRQGQFDYIPSAALATEKATGFLETGRWDG